LRYSSSRQVAPLQADTGHNKVACSNLDAYRV